MPELWKAWKAKSRLPTLSTSSLEISPKAVEISTFPQPRRSGPEKWKTKSRFSTFPSRFAITIPVCSPKHAGALRPRRRSAPPLGVIVVDREK
jgi:hypothetical protein